jgi:hypothetical protein
MSIKHYALGALLCLASIGLSQQPARLHCEIKTYPQYGQTNPVVVLYVTGGVSNVQYIVATPSGRNVGSTNWSYTYRMYSRDFLANPDSGERIVYTGNEPTFRPREFYKIIGVLPD